MHTHYCEIGKHHWHCDDETGDGSDTDCRWYNEMTCEQHWPELRAAIDCKWRKEVITSQEE